MEGVGDLLHGQLSCKLHQTETLEINQYVSHNYSKAESIFLMFVGMFRLLFFLPSCFTDLGH